MTVDLKYYFLQSILPDPEYVHIHGNTSRNTFKANTILTM